MHVCMSVESWLAVFFPWTLTRKCRSDSPGFVENMEQTLALSWRSFRAHTFDAFAWVGYGLSLQGTFEETLCVCEMKSCVCLCKQKTPCSCSLEVLSHLNSGSLSLPFRVQGGLLFIWPDGWWEDHLQPVWRCHAGPGTKSHQCWCA